MVGCTYSRPMNYKSTFLMLKNIFAKLAIALLTLGLITMLAITAINIYVTRKTTLQTYDDVAEIPHRKVGLLLGCSRYAAGGRLNQFYQYRINAAVALYKAGKIDFILASGDNRTLQYNEPRWMREDLIKRGIPAQKIYLDYAGLRTLDSVVRCNRIFGQDKFTIISQPFHNQRAIFIAHYWKIDAIGFNAQDVTSSTGFTVLLREKLARVLMMIDLWTGREPRHYGDPVEIK